MKTAKEFKEGLNQIILEFTSDLDHWDSISNEPNSSDDEMLLTIERMRANITDLVEWAKNEIKGE